MKLICKFIRILLGELKKLWILEITYPRKFSTNHTKSLIPVEVLKNSKGLFIEKNVTIKNTNLVIGKHTYIGNNTNIDSCISIGAFCSISSDVKIGVRNHPLNHISTSPIFYSKYREWLTSSTFDERNEKAVIIEDDVLISANVLVINGIKIGRGAVIGAGAIVNRDVPPYSIVAGVPAKILKYRFSEDIIAKIEESRWWEIDDSFLKNHLHLSNSPEAFIKALDSEK